MKTAPRVGEEGNCRPCHAPHYLERGPCASCHRGDPGASRQTLAHQRLISGRAAENGLANGPAVVEGRERVESLACRRCHRVGGVGNRLATNLDHVVWRRDQGALVRSIGDPVVNMPRFGMNASQTEAVIAFLLRSAKPELAEATYRVRFARRDGPTRSGFDERCGGCHRALLADGPAGRGSAGPNLSGLFTREYPATAAGNRPWTPAQLRSWVQNPRALRPRTTMRPLRLEEGEWLRLVDELVSPAPIERPSAP